MDDITIEHASSNISYSVLWNNSDDIERRLVENLGPRQKDFVSAVLLTIVYSVIFVSGMFGNICTCLVIARNHSMQTTTNYYLFSLAISDLLLIFFGLPPELYSIWEAYPWRLGHVVCYLRQSMLESTSYASVLTITAFTVERYLAICHPLLAHKISALSRAVKIVISIWIISLVVALPYSIHTRVYHAVVVLETNQPVPDSLICNIPSNYLGGFMYYMFQVSTFLFFVGPVTIITILYILIGIELRQSPLARRPSDEKIYAGMKSMQPSPHRNRHQQPRRVVIRMLVAVTVAFITCWAPFHAQRLMVLYVVHWTPQLHLLQSHIFYISGVLYFVSSTVNPVLYNVISKRYRAAFRQTIFPCWCSRPHRANNSTAHHSERFSKSQAMVVLKNGGETVRVVFRQEFHNPTKRDCETIPLTDTRRNTMLDEEEITSYDRVPESSTSSAGSMKLPLRSSTQRDDYCQSISNRETIHSKYSPYKHSPSKHSPSKHSPPIQSRFNFTNSFTKLPHGKENSGFISQSNKTAEILKKSERPRTSYAHEINGCVSVSTELTPTDYESLNITNSSVLR